MTPLRHLLVVIISLLVLASPSWVSGAGEGTLTVQVQGLTSDDGNLRFVLFDSKTRGLRSSRRS